MQIQAKLGDAPRYLGNRMAKELSSSSPEGLSSLANFGMAQWSMPSWSHGFGLSCCARHMRVFAKSQKVTQAGVMSSSTSSLWHLSLALARTLFLLSRSRRAWLLVYGLALAGHSP